QNAPVDQVQPIPFFENVFAPIGGNGATATQAFYSLMQSFYPSWTDALHYLDASSPEGSTIYGAHTFFQQQFDWVPTWTNQGQSSYHAFQLIVRKRFETGLLFDFNYTLSRSKDNGSALESQGQGFGQILNAFDPRQSISYSDFDVRHDINSNFVLDIPAGRDRRFASQMPPVLNALLGNWGLSGIVHWHSGFPFASGSGNGFHFPTNFFVPGPPALKPGA